MEAGEYDFSSIIGRVMKQVYERKVKTGNIDGELFRKTYEELNKKAAEGWGEDDYNDPEQAEEPQRIRDNLFKFSGAKTYQEIKEMNDALYDDKGKNFLMRTSGKRLWQFIKTIMRITFARNLKRQKQAADAPVNGRSSRRMRI